MNASLLNDMFPSLTRSEVEATLSTHPNENDCVNELMRLVERKGGVGSASSSASSRRRASFDVVESPFEPEHEKVDLPHHGRIPFYWEEFWRVHESEFAPLKRKDAERALFFDKYFIETSESEGKSEMLNVLEKLKRRSH